MNFRKNSGSINYFISPGSSVIVIYMTKASSRDTIPARRMANRISIIQIAIAFFHP